MSEDKSHDGHIKLVETTHQNGAVKLFAINFQYAPWTLISAKQGKEAGRGGAGQKKLANYAVIFIRLT